MPPSDGEGTPPDGDDELLAKVIPLRRRGGEPPAAQILADEPRGTSDPAEGAPTPIEWSIWEAPPAELRPRERKPSASEILADEPRGASDRPGDPPALTEWSVWDGPPPELRLRRAPDAAQPPGARAPGRHILARRPPRRLIGTVAATAATITAATALALALGGLNGQSGPASQRTSSGLRANRPTRGSPGLAKRSRSRRRRSTAARAGISQKASPTAHC